MLDIRLAALLLAVVLLTPSVGLASRSAEPIPALSPQTRFFTRPVGRGPVPGHGHVR